MKVNLQSGSGKTIKISNSDTSTPDPNDETELKEITGINTSYKAISKFSLSSDTALDNNISTRLIDNNSQILIQKNLQQYIDTTQKNDIIYSMILNLN